MPTQVICPSCRLTLRAAEEQTGRNVRCPGCSTVLLIPTTAEGAGPPSPPAGADGWDWNSICPRLSAAAAPILGDEGGASRWQSGPEWEAVYRGLGLVRVSLLLSLALTAVACLALIAHGASQAAFGSYDPLAKVSLDDHPAWLLAQTAVGLVSAVLLLLGRLFCCRVPPKTLSRGPAILAAALTTVAVFVIVLNLPLAWLVAQRKLGAVWSLAAAAILLVAAVGGELSFLSFLGRVGDYLRARPVTILAWVIQLLLVGAAALTCASAVLLALLPALPAGRSPAARHGPLSPTNPIVTVATGLGILVGVAVVTGLYLFLLAAARRAIRSRLPAPTLPSREDLRKLT
jgi:hypothetical protein